MNDKGSRSEQIAMQYLIKKGYQHLQSNFTAKCGEIDLIMYNDRYIIFTEVRMRASADYGHPIETITQAKKQKIRKTAEYWLMKNPKCSLQPRIDVIAITAPDGDREKIAVEHIENAF